MDRRQRKSREAILSAFAELLSKKDFEKITVGDIIDSADVGRATFYAHFETKDFLLKEFCGELFCHIFDTETGEGNDHRHIFRCDDSGSVFFHLLSHLQRNDNNILTLLSSRNNELFLRYFRPHLERLIELHPEEFESGRGAGLPDDFYKNHIVSTFTETVKWWVNNGMKESPQTIEKYFLSVV